jgi:thioredoxin-like negative regulator of GroEL
VLSTPEKGLSRALAALLLVLTIGAPALAEPPHTEGWLTDLEEARQQAREKDRLIVVDLWADWCTWCKKLDAEVFSTDTFREWAEDFVLLRVNTEDGAEGTRLQFDFGVSGLPTTLIITHDLKRIVQLQGFAPADVLIQNLELERAMHSMMVRSYEDIDEETGADTIQNLADDFHARRDGERAAGLYARLLELDTENPEETAWNHYYYADSLRLHGQWERASAALRKAREQAARVELEEVLELADLLPYHIARDREECSDAAAALEHYLEQHPEGIYLHAAEDALEEIRKGQSCA